MITNGIGGDLNPLAAYGEPFIAALRATPAFALWDRTTDSVIFDLIEPRHPCLGKPDLVADVGIRLAEGVHDLRLDGVPGLAKGTEALAKGGEALSKGGETVWRAYSSLVGDFARRQAEYRERKEREAAAAPPATPSTTVSDSPKAGLP